ncbi:MAG: hypothetical protein IKQ61_01560 [Spirochaetales bacterium]|nr:hypothetical protein [Spirochaetales bacterium]
MIDNEKLDEHIDRITNRNRFILWRYDKVQKRRTVLGIVLLSIFAAAMTAGLIVGDLENNILPKAIRFCLECIGIG